MNPVLERMRERLVRNGAKVSDLGVVSGRLIRPAASKQYANGPMEISAIATTEGVDLDDEVVAPEGLDPWYFRRYPAVYWNHDYGGVPVATMRTVALMGDKSGWRVRMVMGRSAFARDVAMAIEDGAVAGTSIGFNRLESGEPSDEEQERYGQHSRITRKADWMELSITPSPANPEARIEGFVLPDETAKAIEALAVKGRIARESAWKMGLPKPKRIISVPKILTLGP